MKKEIEKNEIITEVEETEVKEVKETEIEEIVLDKSIEEKKSKIKFDEDHEALDYESRGFKSYQEAKDFIETKYFKGLGKADQDEYTNWLF